MKKQIIGVILASCFLLLSACSPKVNAKTDKTEIADFKSELSYYAFPKTDWGMTPQQVMKAWNLSPDDISITPHKVSDTELGVKLAVNKPIEIIGEPVSNVYFTFDYLQFLSSDKGGYGLTVVSVDFNFDCLEKVQEAFKKTFGDNPGASNLNPSKGTFETLPAEKQASIIKVLSDYSDIKENNSVPNFTVPADFPTQNALSMCGVEQLVEKPYNVQVKYYGKIAAMANTDFDKILEAMNERKKHFEIDV